MKTPQLKEDRMEWISKLKPGDHIIFWGRTDNGQQLATRNFDRLSIDKVDEIDLKSNDSLPVYGHENMWMYWDEVFRIDDKDLLKKLQMKEMLQ